MLTGEPLSRHVRELHDDGYTLIYRALPAEWVAEVRRAHFGLFRELLRSGDPLKIQHSHSGEHHYQVCPPLTGIFGSPDLVANPLAIACVREILGSDLRIMYYNSNIASPGSTVQRAHRDHDHLFGDEMDSPTPAFTMVVNILLTDFTEENGSTYVWPGTHLVMDRALDIPAVDSGRSRIAASGCQLNAQAGSIVIRDARLLHRGMPNRTTQPRSMLSLVYKRNWLKWRYDETLTPDPETFASWSATVRKIFSDENEADDEPGRPVKPSATLTGWIEA